MTYKNGNFYEGQWFNNQRQGSGKFVSKSGETYDGEFSGDEFSGYGKLTYSNGGFYEGEWRKSKRHGHGKDVFNDGSMYEGQFHDDMKQGKGKFTFADQPGCVTTAFYDGHWLANKRNGNGLLRLHNGDQYEGHFKNDSINGLGRMDYHQGGFYEGNWSNSKPHGQGKKVSHAGETTFEGMFYAGKPDTEYYAFQESIIKEPECFFSYPNWPKFSKTIIQHNQETNKTELIKSKNINAQFSKTIQAGREIFSVERCRVVKYSDLDNKAALSASVICNTDANLNGHSVAILKDQRLYITGGVIDNVAASNAAMHTASNIAVQVNL